MSKTLEVLRFFIKTDERGNVDASGVVSRECYEAWLASKGDHVPEDPEDAFRKLITGHCIVTFSFRASNCVA